MGQGKIKQGRSSAPSQQAIKDAVELIDRNIAFGNIDDDTATITTGGLIGDIADLFDRIAVLSKL